MRIVVLSDAHGYISPVEQAIEQSKPDVVIYCGDGVEKVEDISYLYNDIKFYFVKGNCDRGDYLLEQEIVIISKKVFFTHGHLYDVKSGYGKLIAEAKRRAVDIVMFGHTHIPLNEYHEGLYVLNPGSCARPQLSKPSYAFVDIVGKSIITNIVYL